MRDKKHAYSVRACLDNCLKAKHKGHHGNPCLLCIDAFVREKIEAERERIAQLVTDCIRSEIPFVDVPSIIRSQHQPSEAG